jgi:hypothetical protein
MSYRISIVILGAIVLSIAGGCESSSQVHPLFDPESLWGSSEHMIIDPNTQQLANMYRIVTIPNRPHYLGFGSGFGDPEIYDADFLKAFPYMEKLDIRTLNLSGQQLTDTIVPQLVRLKTIRELYVAGTQFSSEGLKQLKVLPRLRMLYIGRNINADQFVELCGELRHVEITYDLWWERAHP